MVSVYKHITAYPVQKAVENMILFCHMHTCKQGQNVLLWPAHTLRGSSSHHLAPPSDASSYTNKFFIWTDLPRLEYAKILTHNFLGQKHILWFLPYSPKYPCWYTAGHVIIHRKRECVQGNSFSTSDLALLTWPILCSLNVEPKVHCNERQRYQRHALLFFSVLCINAFTLSHITAVTRAYYKFLSNKPHIRNYVLVLPD
jgi:hypothetical protein